MGILYPRQIKTCLPIFNCLQAERATRQRRPLVKLKTKRLVLAARRWKRAVKQNKCRGHAKCSTLPTANKNLFADL